VRIEPGGGVLAADPEHSAPLRCLGLDGLATEEREHGSGGDRSAAELEQISAADIGRGYACSHLFPLMRAIISVGLYVGGRN
jgi:hypothetical protein